MGDWAYPWDRNRRPFERGKAIVLPNGVVADDFVAVADSDTIAKFCCESSIFIEFADHTTGLT